MIRLILISFCLFSIGLYSQDIKCDPKKVSHLEMEKKLEAHSGTVIVESDVVKSNAFFQEFEDDDQGLLYYLAWFLHDLIHDHH